MRVIGGSARGRPLRAPDGTGTRPTSDRVREAIFDILGSLAPVDDATAVDLFAGSGALGIEAASRGARSVTFVESDRRAASVIEDNLVRTGLGGAAGGPGAKSGGGATTRIVVMDVLTYCRTTEVSVDLALIDPPYSFEDWEMLLSSIDFGIAVCESKNPVVLPEGLALHRVYRYGTTLVTVAISPNHRVLEARS